MASVHNTTRGYLQTTSPENWHMYVAGSNYDDHLPHLQWLAAQAELNEATAVWDAQDD